MFFTFTENALFSMPWRPTKVLLALFASLLLTALNAQHPAWRNYTTADGLPSNEIYAMLQDSRGFLWFGTDLGLCRFNGYEFTRPVDTSAAVASPVFQIVEDARGRIWFNHLDELWIVENDTVRPWPYNDLLKAFESKSRLTLRFAVGKDGAVWISSKRDGFLVVQPNGVQQLVPALHRNVFLFSEIDGQAIYAQEATHEVTVENTFARRIGQTYEIIRCQEDKSWSLGRFPNDWRQSANREQFQVWRLKNGDFIGCFWHTYYLIRDNQLIWHGQKDAANQIWENPDGSILMAVPTGKNQGVLRFHSIADFQHDNFENLLPGHVAIQVLRDHESGWWVITSDAGVFYCKNTGLDIYDRSSGLPFADILLLASDGQGKIYAGLRSLDVAVFLHAGPPVLLPRPPILGWEALRFDTLTGRLWAGNDLCFWDKSHWVFIEAPYYGTSSYVHLPVKKITPDLAGTHWWASNFGGFFSIDRRTGKAVRITQTPPSSIRTFSVTPDREGNLWVTTMEGLRLWRDGHYELPPFSHPALRFQARNVEVLPPGAGGGLVIALRGGGLLLRDQNGRFTHLTTKDGLTADWLSDLDISPEGVIYACSSAGLNILTLLPDGHWRIETFTAKHGLPSNRVNDVALLGDKIWVATDQGIARFREKPAPASMPAPWLEKFVVNNRDTVFSEHLRLAHDQNNVALRFFAIHFRSGGDIPYRYRLLGGDTSFVYTHTREVNFANLSPRHYTFEVQAQNEDGQWSEPSHWPFEIRSPWWATWWFRVLVAMTLAAGAYLFYRSRVRQIRRDAALHEKVRNLETSALRAQMNPHFIFNCLQSIQAFIARNDRDAAASYLARFAKLVRLALHGSVNGRHSLREEMAMLENYLHLEQLRFGEKFAFTIHAEKELDVEDITFPPLLVQPFVENALWHGLKGRENGGLVAVFFSKKGDDMEVVVTDNGMGFADQKDKSEEGIRPYKSVGMMLTQKRLDLLGGMPQPGTERLVRETAWDVNGVAVGACVRILIPMMY